MNRDSYSRIAAIAAEVLETEVQERKSRLADLCGDDTELLEAASRLIAFAEPEKGVFSDDALDRQRAQLDSMIDSVVELDPDEGWIPPRIGAFEILRRIGRGGTGVVFAAQQDRPSRSVAIKLLHPALATQETVLRLKREAEVLGSLRHAGIAQVFDAGVFDVGAGEQPYLVMELIDGYDLLAHAEREGLGLRARIMLLAQVTDAVAHAHQRGVVHRDLKPDNILVEAETGQPKLLDFGIAGADGLASTLGATADGQLLGTVGYMAPEQASGNIAKTGPPADVFSICAIAYELLLHRPLRRVEGLSITQILSEVSGREAPRLRDVAKGIPRDLATIIEKGLEQSPRDRYATAQEIGADLRRWLENRPIVAKPPSSLDRVIKFARRNPVLVAGVAATTLALSAGLVSTLRQAHIAEEAQAQSRQELYGAQMVLATDNITDPATSQQLAGIVERWRPRPSLEADGIAPDFEWHLLDSVRRRSALELAVDGDPLPIAWSPDGARIAVGLGDRIAIHSATTGAELSALEVGQEGGQVLLTCIKWSRSAPNRVYFSGVQALGAWDVGAAEVRWVQRPAFSSAIEPLPDGTAFALKEDGSLRQLDGATGNELARVPGDFHLSAAIPYCSVHACLLAPTQDWKSTMLDTRTGTPLPSRMLDYGAVTSFRWHPSGGQVALSFHSGDIRVFGVDPWELKFSAKAHRETAHCVAWSDDGRYLASASSDRTVRLLDGEKGTLIRSFVGHHRPVREVHFRPGSIAGGKVELASVGAAGKVIVWDVGEPDAVHIQHPDGFGPFDLGARLRWKPVTGELLAWDRDCFLSIDLEGDRPPRLQKGLGRAYQSADGQLRFIVGRDQRHRIEDANGASVVEWSSSSRDPFLRGAWHLTRPEFVAASYGGIYWFELSGEREAQPLFVAPLEEGVTDIAWNSEGTEVALSTLSARALVVAVPSGKVLLDYTLPSPHGCNCITWSPDGRRVAFGGSDGQIRVLDAHAGAASSPERILSGHSFEIEGIDWHPNGRRIASASRDRTVKLWDAATGQLVASLECKNRLSDVAWVRGGAALIAVDVDGRIYTYDATKSLQEAVLDPPLTVK